MNEKGTTAQHLYADEPTKSKNSALKTPPQSRKVSRHLKPRTRIRGPTDSGPEEANEDTKPKRTCVSKVQKTGPAAKKPLLICRVIAEYPKTFLGEYHLMDITPLYTFCCKLGAFPSQKIRDGHRLKLVDPVAWYKISCA